MQSRHRRRASAVPSGRGCVSKRMRSSSPARAARTEPGCAPRATTTQETPASSNCFIATTFAKGCVPPVLCSSAQVDEPPFFQAGNDIQLPTGNRFEPLAKEPGIVAVTQGAGGDNARPFHSVALHRAMKTAQHLERMRHGLGIEVAVAKNAFTQACNFAVLVQRDQPPPAQFGNAEPHRVGTNVDRGKDRHG